jgi:hypothetical protein
MTTPEARLHLTLNRAVLRAEKRAGKWRFRCDRWPDFAALFDGDESANDAIEEFYSRAAGTVSVTKAARGKKR